MQIKVNIVTVYDSRVDGSKTEKITGSADMDIETYLRPIAKDIRETLTRGKDAGELETACLKV